MIKIKRCFIKDEVDSVIDSPEMSRKSDSNDLVDSLIPPLNMIDLKADDEVDDEVDDGSKGPGKDKKTDSQLKLVKMMNANGKWKYCKSDLSFGWISCPFDKF